MQRSGPLLVLDTATGRSGAMVYDQTPLATALAEGDRPRSNEIFPLARQALTAASVTLSDLAAIVITIGPGSFTGLRVGYGCAAGLADALGLPLLGIPTLTAMAVGADIHRGTIVPLLKARKNELYAALFSAGAGRPTRRTPDFAPTPDALAQRLEGEVTFVGDGFQADGPLATKGGSLADFGATPERSPLIGAARIGADALAEGKEAAYPADLVYVRRSQAELNWDRLHPQPSTGGNL